MSVFDLEHVRRERVGGQAVHEVPLSLQESLRRRLAVRPLEVVAEAYKPRVLLERIDADIAGTTEQAPPSVNVNTRRNHTKRDEAILWEQEPGSATRRSRLSRRPHDNHTRSTHGAFQVYGESYRVFRSG